MQTLSTVMQHVVADYQVPGVSPGVLLTNLPFLPSYLPSKLSTGEFSTLREMQCAHTFLADFFPTNKCVPLLLGKSLRKEQ